MSEGLRRGAPQPWDRRTARTTASTSTVGGGVSTHFHDASAIVSGRFGDDRLREPLASLAPFVDDLDEALDTGWWSATVGTAHTPDGTAGVGQTIQYSPDLANYRAQTFHEVVSPFRFFRRTQNFGTWTPWTSPDSYDTVVLAAVGAFTGSVTLRLLGGIVHADGAITRAAGSSTSYTTCTAAIPGGFAPAADTELTGGAVFNTAVTCQFRATSASALEVRMSGATASAMTVNGHWAV